MLRTQEVCIVKLVQRRGYSGVNLDIAFPHAEKIPLEQFDKGADTQRLGFTKECGDVGRLAEDVVLSTCDEHRVRLVPVLAAGIDVSGELFHSDGIAHTLPIQRSLDDS